MTAAAGHSETHALALSWLTWPRWGAAGAFLVALLLSQLGVVQAMAPAPIAAAAAIIVVTNLLAPTALQTSSMTGLTAGVLIFDAIVLTVVLYMTGGASNPLTALYLIPIALAAVMLPARWAWILAGLTIGAFGLLFLSPEAAAGHGAGAGHGAHAGHAGHGVQPAGAAPHEGFSLHLRGMWAAFTLTAISLTYFVTRVTGALRKREGQLSKARTRVARAERVASLASLAASTAHELGTPLGSISLAASEMERAIDKQAEAAALRDDVALVRGQAKRCREILDAMLTEAGETVGEAPVETVVQELVSEALAQVPEPERERIDVNVPPRLPRVRLPRKTMAQALHNLLRNALDASSSESRVVLTVEPVEDCVRFVILDRGVGMNPEALEEAMEPFVTSKADRGQGLGLFLTRAVAERLGGKLSLSSVQGEGTTAIMEVSCEPVGGA